MRVSSLLVWIGKHHEKCPRNALGASRRNARETVTSAGMGSGLSMSSRAEITAKFAKAYVKASKADKGQILDRVVEVTGWSRDNARRRLTAATRPPGAARQSPNVLAGSMPKYSYDALKVLQKVWVASGGQCGRYLVASMAIGLEALERHDELVFGHDRYSQQVRPNCWR